MNAEQNKLFEKIKKLLALADPANGASEGEVQTATLMVNKLLQDNGLSLAQVQASGEKADTAREKAVTERRAHYKWQRELMSMLAEANFCWHTVQQITARDPSQKKGPDGLHPWRKSNLHILIGRPINIQVTVALYDYLGKAISREADKRDYEHGTRDNNLFFEGAVSRLAERLRDQKARREKEQREEREKARAAQKAAGVKPSSGTDLVILEEVYSSEEDYNEDFRRGLPLGTTAKERAKRQLVIQEQDAKLKVLTDQGMDWYEAWYRSRGYDEKTAKKYAAKSHAHDKRNAGKGYRFSAKDRQRFSSSAFSEGREAAENIGLDQQVGHDSKHRIA